MDRTYIESHDVVARYVKNDLGEQEREAFEDYYFEHPEMLETIESERLLRAAMQAHAAAQPAPGWARSRQQVYAVAASLLIGFMLASALSMMFGNENQGVGQVQTAWLIVDRQGGPASIELASFDQPLALTVEVSGGLEGAVRAELYDANDKRLWGADDVRLDAVGDLSILMPVDVLGNGSYRLRLESNGELLDEYRFNLNLDNKVDN